MILLFFPLAFSLSPSDLKSMSIPPAPAKPLPANDRPESGAAALLRAIGLAAVQVAPGVVALTTDVQKRAA